MDLKLLASAMLGLAGTLLLGGCNDGSAAPPPAVVMTPQVQPLDTTQVLSLAKAPSETADPEVVGPGALLVADSDDETSDPIEVTA